MKYKFILMSTVLRWHSTFIWGCRFVPATSVTHSLSQKPVVTTIDHTRWWYSQIQMTRVEFCVSTSVPTQTILIFTPVKLSIQAIPAKMGNSWSNIALIKSDFVYIYKWYTNNSTQTWKLNYYVKCSKFMTIIIYSSSP